MKKLPPEEYYKSLPKKRMGSGVLFFNNVQELLVVKPNYKEEWSIPGGTVDENESPKAAAIRETEEEIGLKAKDLKLLCIEHTPPKGIRSESLQFIFHGGTLNDTDICQIKLQEDELDAFAFVPVTELKNVLIPGLRERVEECLQALKRGEVIYRESVRVD